jgi:hypothetical protein
VTTAAHTDQVVLDADRLQYELSEGPCLDAAFEDHTYVSNDLARDERWPSWGRRVAELGIASVVAVQLTGGALGALNLYGSVVRAYDRQAIDVATTYGVLATGAMEAARLISGLETALRSRHAIGMAQGVLVSQFGLTPDRAFEVLRRFSSEANVPLRDVAVQVVEQGQLPVNDIQLPQEPDSEDTASIGPADSSADTTGIFTMDDRPDHVPEEGARSAARPSRLDPKSADPPAAS